MHAAALALVAIAGILAAAAAWLRWRSLGRSDADAGDRRWLAAAWAGFAALTAGLLLSLTEAGHRDFSYFVLAMWAAVAAVLFAGRFLSSPSRALLLLPLGAVALLLAMIGAFRLGEPAGEVTRIGGTPAISWIHIAFIILATAVLAVAGAAGALFHIAAWALKRDSLRGLRLPPLPQLERLVERGLVLGTALLSAALATGGAAMQMASDVAPGNPTVIAGVANLGLLLLVLGLRAGGRLSRRAMATAAVASLGLSVLGAVTLLLVSHGQR